MRNMKRVLPFVLVAAIVIATALGASLLKPNKVQVPKKSAELAEQLVKACDLLSVEDAKTVLGQDIEPADGSDAAAASSDDIAVSRCVFAQKLGAAVTPASQKQASLVVRSPRSDTGKQANRNVFTGSAKPANVEQVSGFGESAFWNPEFGQLNILKNDAWYIVEAGPSVPTERKAEDAKTLARTVL